MKINFCLTPIILGIIISFGISISILFGQQNNSTAQQILKIRRKPLTPTTSSSQSYHKRATPTVYRQLPVSPSRGYPKKRKAAISER
jgi:hypothetical protein